MTGDRYEPILWPILASAAFIAAIALYLWRRRADTKGARTLALVGSVLVAWCLGAAAEVATTDFAAQRMWFVLRDALTLPAVVLAFWFTLQYAGVERFLKAPAAAAIVGVLVVYIALQFVDGGSLLWSRIESNGEIHGIRTPLGLAFGGFAIALFLCATAVLLLLFVRSPAHRVPVAIILVGQVAIRVVYAIGVFDFVYVPNIVLGIVGFDIVAAMYAIALFRFRLFDLVPVARQTILQQMPDALFVLDTRDRVVDVNNAARRLLATSPGGGGSRGEPMGASGGVGATLASLTPESSEVALGTNDGERTFQVTTTHLTDWQRRPIGRLVHLHDITALRDVERQLVERERAVAAAQERERLARELHDGLAQDLWLAKLKATRLAAEPELGREARALTEEVTAAVDAGIAEARGAVAAMRVGGRDGGPLRELLSHVLEDFEDRFGLGVAFECPPELPELPARTEAEALRIVQEALTNVRRHADATLVRVRAAIQEDELVIEIRDNGRGFEVDAVGRSPYGLAGMRERADLIDGRLEIESAPRKGTLVRLAIPRGDVPAPAAAR